MSESLRPHGLYSPWNSPGQNTGLGSLSLLQGIVLTQRLNPDFPHCRWILYQLSHKGSPRILEWVAYPFSRGSSRSRNWTSVSRIVRGFFTNWAISEDIYSPWEGIKCPWLFFMAKLAMWSLLTVFLCFCMFLLLIKLILWLKFFHRQKAGGGHGGQGP